MSKRENELDKQKNQNRLSAAKDNPETDIYENPIENAAEMVNEDIRPMKTGLILSGLAAMSLDCRRHAGCSSRGF
jgi:hypothetical protein